MSGFEISKKNGFQFYDLRSVSINFESLRYPILIKTPLMVFGRISQMLSGFAKYLFNSTRNSESISFAKSGSKISYFIKILSKISTSSGFHPDVNVDDKIPFTNNFEFLVCGLKVIFNFIKKKRLFINYYLTGIDIWLVNFVIVTYSIPCKTRFPIFSAAASISTSSDPRMVQIM